MQENYLKLFYIAYQVDKDSTAMIRELINNLIDTPEVDDLLPTERDEPKHAGPEMWEEVLSIMNADVEKIEEEEKNLQDLIS